MQKVIALRFHSSWCKNVMLHEVLCLLILVTRKRVYIFFDADLICGIVLLQLVSDILRYDPFVASHSIHIVVSAQ